MNKILTLVFLTLLVSGCMVSKKNRSAKANESELIKDDSELNQLASLMEGKFSSELHAKKDTSYFNISLVMTPIWTNRTDGIWLYVEQAMASQLDKPYRQRVYNLKKSSPNIFTSDIYTIKDALSFAGLYDDQVKKDKLTFNMIELKEGCTVKLEKKGDKYKGGTNADHCPSDLRGATYAITKIVLKKGVLISWDQGFDASGKQVWGATKGGYIFVKK